VSFTCNEEISQPFEWDDNLVYFNYGTEFAIDKKGRYASRANPNSRNYFSYYDTYLKNTFLKNKINPYMVIDAEGSFKNLDDVKLDKYLQEICNSKRMDIYLWEIPIIGVESNPGISFDSFADIIYDFDKADSVMHGTQCQELRCYEFEKIKEFTKQNNLQNVTVHTGLYDQEQYFEHYDFKLKTQDIYLSCTVIPTDSKYTKTFTYNPNTTIPNKNKIKHKFINLNKRYEGFRQIVAAHMLDKDCVCSYIHKHTDLYIKENNRVTLLKDSNWYWEDINHRVSFDCKDLFNEFINLEYNSKKLEEKQVLTVDRSVEDREWLQLDNDEEFYVPTNDYYSAFCAVVSESTFAFPVAHFADKTINAIKLHRPFVLVAPPRTLEYMKKLGFKTFDKWWNESYDTEKNHLQRLKSVLHLINDIDKMNIEECQEMYKDMIPVLEHNFALLKQIRHHKGLDIASTK